MEYENSNSIEGNFFRARKFSERKLGIKLSLIELVELKNIVKNTTRIYSEDKKKFLSDGKWDDKQINPDYEAALIFLNRNYGIQIYNLEDKNEFDWRVMMAEEDLGFDYYAEGFKKMQDEMHTRLGY